MPISTLSLSYLPVAIGLGALHALEPGHAKTMTAVYLVGINGRWSDAILLGLAAALTHSAVVIAIAVAALTIGREAFAGDAIWWLQIISGGLVAGLGAWLLWRRLRSRPADHPVHHHDNHDAHTAGHVHADEEDAHARAHAAQMPGYVGTGFRPTWWQVVGFGAAGGLVPCPASISVMLLALTLGSTVSGVVLVCGFSLGLALTLVGIGLFVVASMRRLGASGQFAAWSRHVPAISAGVIMLSGLAALILTVIGSGHHTAG